VELVASLSLASLEPLVPSRGPSTKANESLPWHRSGLQLTRRGHPRFKDRWNGPAALKMAEGTTMRLRCRGRRRVQVRNPFPAAPNCRLGPIALDKSISLSEQGEKFGDANQIRENN
jgi:hypothetical protein